MQAKYLGVIIIILLLGVGGYFLLRGGYQTQAPAPTQTETLPATQAPVSGVTEISVVGTEFSFSPASINARAGEKVKITFRNNGRASHNLTVERLEIGTRTISSGQTETLEFVAPASGTYAFFCSVPGHRSSGMEGSLLVE